MRYMLLLKAPGRDSVDTSRDDRRRAMQAFNDRLVRGGVLLAGADIADRETDAMIAFDGDSAMLTVPATARHDGIVAFWILQVSSRDEAVEWARRIPATEGCADVHRLLDDGEREAAT